MSGDKTSFPSSSPIDDLFRKPGSLPPPLFLMKKNTEGKKLCDEIDLFPNHFIGDHNTIDRKQIGTRTILQLQHEILLRKMGFDPGTPINWNTVILPPKTALHKLLYYRISNYICPDILVKIGNHEYRCHLLVLQCYSRFFVENASVSRIEIPETNVTKQAFAHIYDWMLHLGGDSYTLLRRDNILEIFVASQFLQVKELEEQCWAFIDNEDLFSEDNAFMLYLDAREAQNTAVMELMVPRIQRFFLTLVSSKEFLEMRVEEVVIFLKSNYICIHCEMEVFMSGVRWVMYDWEKRQNHLVEVMKCVRFGLLSPWQNIDIRRNPDNKEFYFITRNPEVMKMIEDGLAYAIVKSWYCHDSAECGQWIMNLGLHEPPPRNWAGTYKVMDQKNYGTYQDFLSDLAKYRRMHMMSSMDQGEKRTDSKESLNSDLDNTHDLIDFTIHEMKN